MKNSKNMSKNKKITIPFVDFRRHYEENEGEILGILKRFFKKGQYILGPEVDRFEKNFAKYLKTKYVIGVDSGTDALFLALKALGVGDGDEVITVANTFTATVSAIRMTGAIPVFVDVNEDDLVINVSKIEQKITKKTKAIVPVHLYGYPANMTEIVKIAEKYKLFVVEDCCQAHGAELGGKKVGTFGDVGCFSFYPTKNLGGFGDGGAVATDDKKLAEKVRALKSYGEIIRYNSEYEGINSRLDEIQACYLNWKLKDLDLFNKKRELLADAYLKALKDLPIILPSGNRNRRKRVWHLFVIRTRQRDKLRDFLRKNGVTTLIHYPVAISKMKAYRFLKVSDRGLEITIKAAREVLSLPLYPELKIDEVKKVCRLIKLFYAREK